MTKQFRMMDKETIKKIFIEEAFKASAAKVFAVDKTSYHYKNLEKAAESFYERLNKGDSQNPEKNAAN